MKLRVARWPVFALWLALGALALLASPLLVAAGRLARRRPLVAVGRLLRAYVLGELRLMAAARAGADLYAAVGAFLDRLVGIATRTLEVDVALAGDVASQRPLVVLSRHGGPGDSLLLVHVLLRRLGRRPRIVMKEVLALDPAVGVVARRLPNALIDQSSGGAAEAIAQLARTMDARDALLLFPEGANVNAERRRGALKSLLREGELDRAERAARLEHLAAPHPGGVLAALTAAPEADVVFVGHTGLGRAAEGLEVIADLPESCTVRMRLWHVPAADRPSREGDLVDWLDAWWARIDAWVGDPAAG
jgi:1-acyl-sn-glycerol-3-phosphate acyltransferase